MPEDKIEQSLLGKVRATARKYAGVYLLAGGLAVGAVGGCGPETEKCALPTNSEDYVGMNHCPNYWEGNVESWLDGCSKYGDQQCVCEKPGGEPDTECECGCENEPKPHEPITKGY